MKRKLHKKQTCFFFLLFLLFFSLLCNMASHRHRAFQQEIPLNHYHVTLHKGEKFVLKARTFSFVHFQSQDFRIAFVTPGGTVYANQRGVTYIRVTSGGKTSWCRVKVK